MKAIEQYFAVVLFIMPVQGDCTFGYTFKCFQQKIGEAYGDVVISFS